MTEALTDFGWFRPGLEELAPGLRVSGLVYGIYCSKTDAGWVKVGSVNADRATENLRRDIYAGQERYLFVIEAAAHVAAENLIHGALAPHAHAKHKDCFSLLPMELLARCVEVVKPLNERAIALSADRLLRAAREEHHAEIARYERREQVFLMQIEMLMPLLMDLSKQRSQC